MDAIKVIFEEIRDEDFIKGNSKEEIAPDFKFTIQIPGLKITASYSQEHITSEDWNNFVSAIKNNTKHSLCFLSSNGYIGIDFVDGMVNFSVSKYGGDNYGNLCVEVDKSCCIDALEAAAIAMMKYFERT